MINRVPLKVTLASGEPMFINLHGIGTFQSSNKAAFKYCIGLSHDHERDVSQICSSGSKGWMNFIHSKCR